MSRHRFSLIAFATAAYVVAAAFIGRCSDAIFRAIDGALDLFRPEPMRFAGDVFSLERRAFGKSIDSATLNSLRHEAGVPRRGSARNT